MPFGIAVDQNTGLLYVVESGDPSIVVLDPATGNVVRHFGGDDPHVKLSDPRGIAIDAHGNVLVTDRNFNGRVVVFNPDGVFLAQFQTPMPHPDSIHACEDGTVIVSTTNGSAPQMYAW